MDWRGGGEHQERGMNMRDPVFKGVAFTGLGNALDATCEGGISHDSQVSDLTESFTEPGDTGGDL